MFKAKIWTVVWLLVLSFAASAHEIEAKPTTVAIYIQAQDYNHQLRLHHYSTGYWYSQGPMLEDAAIQVLGQDFKDVAMCDENPASAKVLVWLRPRMFYNPQVQTFYGKVIAYAILPMVSRLPILWVSLNSTASWILSRSFICRPLIAVRCRRCLQKCKRMPRCSKP